MEGAFVALYRYKSSQSFLVPRSVRNITWTKNTRPSGYSAVARQVAQHSTMQRVHYMRNGCPEDDSNRVEILYNATCYRPLVIAKILICEITCLLQVVILNDIPNLYEYVDINQLTPCLGGTLNYEHQEWVQHRTVSHIFI